MTDAWRPDEIHGPESGAFDAHSATRRLVPVGAERGWSERPSAAGELPRISIAGPGEGPTSGAPPDLTITGVLGEGGMGTVHVARQRSLQRDVAVKVVRPAAGVGPEALALVEEAMLMGSLEHPNIVPVHALGVNADGLPVLVMKRVIGVAWYDLVRDPAHPYWARLGTFPDDRLVAHLEILMQVCNAVHYAHGHGVVHRDIKPENVMIGEYGEVYLADWGIALRLGSGDVSRSRGSTLAGTPGYLAPEMVGEGEDPIDARTDVYLLGATLHCVLTGQARHTGSTLSQVVVAALRSEPFAYDEAVPAELAAICNRATSARPAERFPTVIAFRQAVADYLRHRGSLALSAAAAAALAAARAETPSPSADDRERLHTSMSECRFGFAQALREWPDNPDARRGMDACIELMFEAELQNENEHAARTLLVGMSVGRDDLAARLRGLVDRLAERRLAEARLRQLEHDRDLGVGAGTRTAFFAVVLALGVALLVVPHLQPGGPQPLSYDDLLRLNGVALAVLTAMILIARRQLLQNAIGRQVVGTFVAIAVAGLINSAIGAQLGTPVPALLVNDMVIVAVASVVGAMTFLRGMIWWAALSMVGAIAAVVFPESARDIHGALTVAILALALALRSERPPAGRDAPVTAPGSPGRT